VNDGGGSDNQQMIVAVSVWYGRRMNEHPSIELVSPLGDGVQIDHDIAPLIQWLWDRGWQTVNSCQDNHGYVWIEFFSATEAEAFLDYIMKRGDETLKSRARSPVDLHPQNRSRLESDYRTWHDNWLIGACADYDDGAMKITISICFPREHLGRVKTCCGLSKMSDDWFTISGKS
jgi:hypothetical protein